MYKSINNITQKRMGIELSLDNLSANKYYVKDLSELPPGIDDLIQENYKDELKFIEGFAYTVTVLQNRNHSYVSSLWHSSVKEPAVTDFTCELKSLIRYLNPCSLAEIEALIPILECLNRKIIKKLFSDNSFIFSDPYLDQLTRQTYGYILFFDQLYEFWCHYSNGIIDFRNGADIHRYIKRYDLNVFDILDRIQVSPESSLNEILEDRRLIKYSLANRPSGPDVTKLQHVLSGGSCQ